METSKQKAIREAYGGYWEKVKDYVDKNGWIRHSMATPTEMLKYHSENKILFDDKVEDNPDFFLIFFRLKSLQGIETNNEWIKIESEEDLPKQDIDCHICLNDGIISIDKFYISHNQFLMTHWKYISHYQPITKPLKPIY